MRRYLYRNFVKVYRFNTVLARYLTRAGMLMILALGLSFLVGVDTRITMAYQLFSLLTAVLLFSVISRAFNRAAITVRRDIRATALAGQSMTYRLIITNHGRRPLSGYMLCEGLCPPLPSFDEFMNTPEPGEKRRNIFDRLVGYHRFVYLITRIRIADPPKVAGPKIAAGKTALLNVTIKPRRRGIWRLENIFLLQSDIFGLTRTVRKIPLADTVTVFPRQLSIPAAAARMGRGCRQGAMVSARRVGHSEEFFSTRDYVPGDPLKHIHWKSWARTGRPVVKEFQEECFLRYAVFLDTCRQVSFSKIFETAVAAAAGRIAELAGGEALVDLFFVQNGPRQYTAGRGGRDISSLFRELSVVRESREDEWAVMPRYLARRSTRLSGLFCIFSEWDRRRRDFLSVMRQSPVPVQAFLVYDPRRKSVLPESADAVALIPVSNDPKAMS